MLQCLGRRTCLGGQLGLGLQRTTQFCLGLFRTALCARQLRLQLFVLRLPLFKGFLQLAHLAPACRHICRPVSVARQKPRNLFRLH